MLYLLLFETLSSYGVRMSFEYLSFKHSNTSLETWDEVEAEVKKYFEEALLSEAFVDRRTYAVPQSTVSSLSTAFTSLEKCKQM